MMIYVVEDALQVRKRLVAMVHTVAGAKVAGEAASVGEAVDGILHSGADAVLLDLQLADAPRCA
jgi:DNA-binding NarL/FixJ family response regulator